MPTGYVWIFTARLVTGKGLPYMAKEWAIGAAVLFAFLTGLRTYAANKSWQAYIPGGIAVAVGKSSVHPCREASGKEGSNKMQACTTFRPSRWREQSAAC